MQAYYYYNKFILTLLNNGTTSQIDITPRRKRRGSQAVMPITLKANYVEIKNSTTVPLGTTLTIEKQLKIIKI